MARRGAQPDSLQDAFRSLKGNYKEQIRADYDATKYSVYRRNRTGYLAMGSSADWHYRIQTQYLRMMEQARDMARNDAIIGTSLDRAADNMVQGGFHLSPQTGDEALNKDLHDYFMDWARDPGRVDIAGERDFHAVELSIARQWPLDGDIFGNLMQSGHLELIEGHRCRTPLKTQRNVVHGILLDDNRRRLEYWFTKDDADPMRQIKLVSEVERFPARDAEGERRVFHVYDPKRVSQTRGVTALAPVFDLCGMWEDLNFAKIVQAQAVSCFAILRKPGPNQDSLPSVDQPYGTQTTQTLYDGSTRIDEAIAPGMQLTARQGEEISGFSPAVPNAEFFQHAKLILSLIGINLGLPYVVMLMDASETNFSGFRGAVDEARKGFRRNQRSMVGKFHTPVYRWKMLQYASDDAAARKAMEKLGKEQFLMHRWQPPAWPYLEPLTDAGADLLKVRNGLLSQRRLHAERGGDWHEMSTEIVEDNGMAIRKAKVAAAAINKEFPDDDQPVHWRELLSLPTPDGVEVKVQQAPNETGESINQNAGKTPNDSKSKPAA